MLTVNPQYNYENKSKLRVVLWLITKEGLAASVLAAFMGLLYGLFLSEEPLLPLVNNAVFLMGVVLGFHALFSGVQRDKKIFKNMFQSDVKDQYLEKLSIRKERIFHLFRAFIVFIVAVVFDLILFFL